MPQHSYAHRIALNLGRVGCCLVAAAALLPRVPAHAATTLVLYSAQHEQMVDMITKAFTDATGIAVQVHSGEAPEIANQLAREGAASPADVTFVENSPELTLLDEKGLLAKLDPATLAAVPAKFSASSGDWVGVLARESVLSWNPSKITQAALPASLMDLAKPEWKGRVAIAPADADFLPLIDAVIQMHGRDQALAWLKGLKANAMVLDDDEAVALRVDQGAVAVGVINSYYWARLQAEQGPAKTPSRVYHFRGGDAGALINVSGAAVLRSSKHPAEAQQFVAFLVSRKLQTMLAEGDVDFEYPLVPGIPANKVLLPYDQLQPPVLTMEQLGDDQPAAALLRESGLL
jgi:iron(III) transport system substrate-binding protein